MLTELVRYAEKNLDSEPGFTARTVRWLVEIAVDGGFVNVAPLGDDKGEQIPKCPEMHNMNSGGRAHFLVETLQTVTLLSKPNEDPKKVTGAREKHAFFTEMVRQASTVASTVLPLASFLDDMEQIERLRNRLAAEKAKPGDWLCWRLAGTDPLQHNEVLDWWRDWREADQANGKKEAKPKKGKSAAPNSNAPQADSMVCFLSGQSLAPLSTQPKITGLSGVGGLGTGDVMAGFDKAAFCSFGLEQARNAAMGAMPARKYVDALNDLIKKHSRKLANTLVVHWFKETVKPEVDPLDFLYEPPELTEAAAYGSARQILESLRRGQRPVPANNRFFAMTLSGAAGRVMVRDWMEGSFEELVAKIEQWFCDLEIVARDGEKTAPAPKFLAVCGAIMRDLKDLPAPTATTLWRVALAGLPIPRPFIARALARFRADLIDDKPFSHARMGLIKAYFIRKGGDHNMSAYLNKEHPEPAYQCGRLLALLASLQRAALGDVGAGVVQRYYVAASQTPGLTLGRLFGNAKNHLNKLEGGLAFWYEDQIAEIMSHIKDSIPTTLDLEGQSLFALGYYQQIAATRAGKKNDTSDAKGDK
ncbi:MAG: type I-C CRISPR-associated protein Cas8c/Csd1 [Syntrophobacteraceae bacterium]|nr:type I-C CRISPR-associated protein Cas8c/Csd1 [Syntrophobacteraceae bacterium]